MLSLLPSQRTRYKYHTGVDKEFDTVSKLLYRTATSSLHAAVRQSLGFSLRSTVQDVVIHQNLSVPIGIAPQDYFMSRSMPGAPDSIFTLLMDTVLPAVLSDKKADKGQERLFLANSGSQRFDIVSANVRDATKARETLMLAGQFAGVFTLNDMLVVSPL